MNKDKNFFGFVPKCAFALITLAAASCASSVTASKQAHQTEESKSLSQRKVYVFSFQGLFSGTPELHTEIAQAIAGMKGKIPGMLSLSVGVNKGTKSKYNIGVLIVFENKDARDAYDRDPVHQVVVDKYGSYLKERSIVEYEDTWDFRGSKRN
jgi:hypothetical protein